MSDMCSSCSNCYTDDCGYCCRKEGEDGMPADDWVEGKVDCCPFYDYDEC